MRFSKTHFFVNLFLAKALLLIRGNGVQFVNQNARSDLRTVQFSNSLAEQIEFAKRRITVVPGPLKR